MNVHFPGRFGNLYDKFINGYGTSRIGYDTLVMVMIRSLMFKIRPEMDMIYSVMDIIRPEMDMIHSVMDIIRP